MQEESTSQDDHAWAVGGEGEVCKGGPGTTWVKQAESRQLASSVELNNCCPRVGKQQGERVQKNSKSCGGSALGIANDQQPAAKVGPLLRGTNPNRTAPSVPARGPVGLQLMDSHVTPAPALLPCFLSGRGRGNPWLGRLPNQVVSILSTWSPCHAPARFQFRGHPTTLSRHIVPAFCTT